MVFRGTEGISRCCVKGGGVIRKLTAKEGGGGGILQSLDKFYRNATK